MLGALIRPVSLSLSLSPSLSLSLALALSLVCPTSWMARSGQYVEANE